MNNAYSNTYQEIEQIANQIEKVDKLNNLAYNLRYSNPAHSSEIANEAYEIAQKEKYKAGAAIGLMHVAFANFLMSSDYPVLQHLVDSHVKLSKANKIPELPIILNYLGNVYDSYGEYQKGIEFCHQALTL